MSKVQEVRERLYRYVAPNYAPLLFVPKAAKGEWVYGLAEERDGKDGFRAILDLHSNYSALSLGHNHPDIVALTIKRLEENRPALFSRGAGMLEELADLGEKICRLSGMEMIIPKNAGVEGFEVAVKAARRWGYEVKGIPDDQAEIIVCEKNFHGRSLAATAASSDPAVREGFGPFGPEWAFRKIPFGDLEALEKAINKNTAAFITEPIQAEAGVIIPESEYLPSAGRICSKNNVLFILDEVQTGLGRTGKLFAWQHYGFRPDGMILGKAIGGGLNVASVFVALRAVLELLTEGTEGSTFGGNPQACAAAAKTLDILSMPGVLTRVRVLGEEFIRKLKTIESPLIKEVRGKGLLVAVELTAEAGGTRRVWEELFREGVLAIKRHDAIGFSPPLIINEHNLLVYAFERIKKVLTAH